MDRNSVTARVIPSKHAELDSSHESKIGGIKLY